MPSAALFPLSKQTGVCSRSTHPARACRMPNVEARHIRLLRSMDSGSTRRWCLGVGEGVELTQPKEVWRSSPTEDYVKVDIPVLEDGVLTVEAPAMSIFTIFF